MIFAQCASLSGQFVQQWELRMTAQEAALKEAAKSKWRRLLAYNESFNSTDVGIGNAAFCYESAKKQRAPGWRGPAKIPEIY